MVLIHRMAVRQYILRLIVCEIPFCCPKRVTLPLIRKDFLGREVSLRRRRVLSGGEG